jgi:hypothetical protein
VVPKMEGFGSAPWVAETVLPSESPPKEGVSSAAMLSSAGVGACCCSSGGCEVVGAPPNPNSVCPNFEGPTVLKAPNPPDFGVVSKADVPFWPNGEVVDPNADAGCPNDV